MSHDDNFLDKYGEVGLDKEEEGVLNDWVLRFEMKYNKIGNVKKIEQTAPPTRWE